MIPERSTVVIQGFGNAGGIAARLLHEAGYKIVAVSDSRGGVYNPNGLDVPATMRYSSEHSGLRGLPGAETVTNQQLLQLPCDILIPAALENQISKENAARVQARLIVEAANGPITPEADVILHDKGAMVVPDILANAGGVTVSYFEWVQDQQDFFWAEQEINQKLEAIMTRSFTAVYNKAIEQGTTLRTAAYLLAVARVAEATELRGIYP
jgi:glutamate dehydrogenase (NAD(P)+)